MPSVLPCPAPFNFVTPDEVYESYDLPPTGESGHPDEVSAPELDSADLDVIDREIAIDRGIFALGDDLGAAEAEVQSHYPSAGFVGAFKVERYGGKTLSCWTLTVCAIGHSPVTSTGNTLRETLDDIYNTLAGNVAA